MLAEMNALSAEAPAKINLTLRVGPRRPDGYHEIESLVARVALCDRVTVEPRDAGALTLSCDDAAIPTDDTNLALRAARALAAGGGGERGAHIRLEKGIPAGSGLGGGSSDAAATLKLLNALWSLGLASEQLAEIGAQIGSDVPLFFGPPLCVVRGRGEQVAPAAVRLGGWAALVLPGIVCSTRDVYAAFDRLEPPPAAAEARPGAADIVSGAVTAAQLMPRLYNDLEPAAFGVHPSLRALHRILEQIARGPVRLTGSGSAFFRLFDDAEAAERFAAEAADVTPCRTEVVRLAT